jgi:nucleoside-diphosphate-sugar epimerase
MNTDKINVVTGATGQLGSHIAEQLRAAGERVRALVRAPLKAAFLRDQGVEVVEGDLRDPAAVRRVLAGADIVYHCAARVSDWGPWPVFEEEAVASTRNLVEACRAEKVGRLLHVSTISVYGHPRIAPGQQITEETPLGQKFWLWDYYPRSKLMAEALAWDYPEVTVVRPSWIYGPRDRITLPRIIPALQQRRVRIIGSGANLLNIIYVSDVAAGAILAANEPQARGQAFNLCSEGEVTQQDMINTMTDALGLTRVTKHIPFSLAMRSAFLLETIARLCRFKNPPRVTRRAIFLIGRPTYYSVAKARIQLGWLPRVKIQEGVRRSMEWYFGNRGLPVPAMHAAATL